MEDVFFTGIVAEHDDVYDDGVVATKYVSTQRKTPIILFLGRVNIHYANGRSRPKSKIINLFPLNGRTPTQTVSDISAYHWRVGCLAEWHLIELAWKFRNNYKIYFWNWILRHATLVATLMAPSNLFYAPTTNLVVRSTRWILLQHGSSCKNRFVAIRVTKIGQCKKHIRNYRLRRFLLVYDIIAWSHDKVILLATKYWLYCRQDFVLGHR